MPKGEPECRHVCLMGPPRILASADGAEVALGAAETELLALLVVGTLLLPPEGVLA